MASEDEIARAYARWHAANERYKELDKQFKETETLLQQAQDATHSIYESRQRTPREVLEEQIQQALLPAEARYDAAVDAAETRYEAAVEAAEAEYDAKVSTAEEEYERDRAAVLASFEVRLAELGDPEDEEHQVEWSSPEYEAAERSKKQISKELEELRQLRIHARHELNEARETKKNLR